MTDSTDLPPAAAKAGGKQRPGARGRPFAPGQSGNPRGRPQGSRSHLALALDALTGAEAEAVVKRVVEAAKQGDVRAADLLLRRIWPERKGRPVAIALPPLTSALRGVEAVATIVQAVATGDLTPEEGQAVAAMVELHRRAVETAELEARITALEVSHR